MIKALPEDVGARVALTGMMDRVRGREGERERGREGERERGGEGERERERTRLNMPCTKTLECVWLARV